MRRNMGRRGNNNSGGNGPLMTGHLQDIDMELELLKRKREMIEQQQHLLAMEQQFNTTRHSYDQTRYDEPIQHGSNRDFVNLYESGPKHRAQFGRKRQAENQWQYDSAPKRTPQKKKNPPHFSMNQQGSGNRNFRPQKPQGQGFNQGSKFSPRGPAPLMAVKIPKQSIGQKIANQKAPPKPANKDFTPAKVSKQKGTPAPNKLASLPVSERKSLVAAASKSANDVSRMLLPDRVPSQQVSGRLELALGAIMKNIRALITAQPQHASVLRSVQQQRVMKQTVRERIRTVMLGKVVGSLNEILAIYREEFPEETDADVLNIALEAGGMSPDQNLNIKFIKSDPGEFFKTNMTTLLETQLNEMFSKLEELYAAPANDAPSAEQSNLENNKEGEPELNKEKDLENNEESENKGESGVENNEESEVENKEESELENTGESELENKEESELQNKESDLENKEESELKNKEGSELENNKETDGNLEGKKDIEKKKGPKAGLDLVKNREEHNKNREFTQEYKEFLNTTIQVYDVKRVIPKLIKRYVPYIVKLMNFDTTYQNSKAVITKIANEKAAKMYIATMPTEQGQGDSNVAATPKKTAAESRQFYNLPYYVKIMGRPSLPKRKVMQTFLAQFNPKTVKKHRTVHNLLFVGFNEKSDFDVIVAADGAVIGRSTLSIRVCPKVTGPKDSNGDNANDESQDEVKVEQKDGDIISPELDGQITDLLSSIRKSEEEEKAKENGVVNENTSEDQLLAENNDVEGEEDFENAGDEEKMTEENQDEAFSEDVGTQNSEKAKEPEVTDDWNKEKNSQQANEAEAQKSPEKTPTKTGEQPDDKLGELKNVTGRSTPARASARLANVTPSTIRTRRASRVASQN